ncbi:MAG: FAD-dependent oxidoreductase [Acetobacter sp.]|uniref:FAD-dependent oxidoreductase n=1 Tax=Acetobacter sp. TaxID=440 RepID=UPI0039E82D09
MTVHGTDGRACDVLVIGGGPAGSTAATLLARDGYDVVLLEKDEHPRFHIGESLLPCNLPLLRDLGVLEQVEAMGVYKPGAEFVSDTDDRCVPFPFRYAIGAKTDHAYQVVRADFDALLFRNAGRHGATTRENIRVLSVQFQSGQRARVRTRDNAGTEQVYEPRFVLDASGRDGLLSAQTGRQANKKNSTAAIFGHFRNVPRRAGDMGGYISIHLVKDGWFWMIPLPDGVMSVGFVGDKVAYRDHKGPVTELFWKKVAQSPSVAERMNAAQALSPLSTTSNYSYCAQKAWGEGYYLIGDAYAFLDPVFSSGVLLAMRSAYRGAGVARAWLRDPVEGRRVAARAERRTQREMRRIAWLIYRINTPVLRMLFLNPRNILRMRDAIISLLAGDFAAGWRVMAPFSAFKAIVGVTWFRKKLRRSF